MLTSLQNVFTCVTFYAVVLASFWYIMTKKKKKQQCSSLTKLPRMHDMEIDTRNKINEKYSCSRPTFFLF